MTEAKKITVRQGKGNGNQPGDKMRWSRDGEKFLILASAIGLTTTAIGNLLGPEWDGKKVGGKIQYYRNKPNYLQEIIDAYNLNVTFDGRHFFADWRVCVDHFPFVRRAVQDFLDGSANREQMLTVRCILAKWAQHHEIGDMSQSARGGLGRANINAVYKNVRKLYQELLKENLDPLK